MFKWKLTVIMEKIKKQNSLSTTAATVAAGAAFGPVGAVLGWGIGKLFK